MGIFQNRKQIRLNRLSIVTTVIFAILLVAAIGGIVMGYCGMNMSDELVSECSAQTANLDPSNPGAGYYAVFLVFGGLGGIALMVVSFFLLLFFGFIGVYCLLTVCYGIHLHRRLQKLEQMDRKQLEKYRTDGVLKSIFSGLITTIMIWFLVQNGIEVSILLVTIVVIGFFVLCVLEIIMAHRERKDFSE